MNLETCQQFTIPWAHREQGLMAQGRRWVWPGLRGAGKLVFIHRREELCFCRLHQRVTWGWERRRAFWAGGEACTQKARVAESRVCSWEGDRPRVVLSRVIR